MDPVPVRDTCRGVVMPNIGSPQRRERKSQRPPGEDQREAVRVRTAEVTDVRGQV